MTDLRTLLHDIANDRPDLDAVRQRLRRPRRHHAPLLAAAGVIAVAVAAAGTALLTGHETVPAGDPGPFFAAPTLPWSASCFGAADLSTDLQAGVGMGQKVGAVNSAPRPEDYFDICAAHWQSGSWLTEATTNADGSVPKAPATLQLIGCVLPDGSYGIFRGTEATCGALDLPVAIAPDPILGVVESPLPTE